MFLYVDEVIIATKTSNEIEEVKTVPKYLFMMKEEFKTVLKYLFMTKKLGKVEFILGMEIDHDRNVSTLMIRQTHYIDDMVSHLNKEDEKVVVNPCDSGLSYRSCNHQRQALSDQK